jgi:hypothetical protein
MSLAACRAAAAPGSISVGNRFVLAGAMIPEVFFAPDVLLFFLCPLPVRERLPGVREANYWRICGCIGAYKSQKIKL